MMQRKWRHGIEEDEENCVLIPGLTNDIAEICIARVPLAFHINLRTVSKPWRRLLLSTSFYFSSPFVELRSPPSWVYVLVWCDTGAQKRTLAVDFEQKFCLLLPPIPNPNSCPANADGHQVRAASFTVLRGILFLIGTPDVWVLDPALNRWDSVPCRGGTNPSILAATIDDKIYVIPSSFPRDLGEMYDPSISSWTPIPIPSNACIATPYYRSVVLDNKLLLKTNTGGVIFDPVSYMTSSILDSHWTEYTSAVVQNALFTYHLYKIRGYLPERNKWVKLAGFGGRIHKLYESALLFNLSGNLGIILMKKCRSLRQCNRALCVCLDISEGLELAISRQRRRIYSRILWFRSISFQAGAGMIIDGFYCASES